LELRFQVSERAAGRCEYCLIHEHDAAFGHEVDHVISRQHGGLSESDNLAFACLLFNRIKGTNLASINPAGGALVRLFNPQGSMARSFPAGRSCDPTPYAGRSCDGQTAGI
jgi:hypothetical protein